MSFGQQVWPVPGERMGEVEWRLRYGGATKEDVLYAASCIAAYRHLVQLSRHGDVAAKLGQINAAVDADASHRELERVVNEGLEES